MKISVNDVALFTLSENQKKVIRNDIADEIFDEDMRRRVEYGLKHKYEQCFKRLKQQWDPILASRYQSVPTDKDEYAQLVFDQPDYKNKTQRMVDDTGLVS